MKIVYSDEPDKLTPEMWQLMQRAADTALEKEFGDELRSSGVKPDETKTELGVTIVGDDEILELNREYREKDRVTDVLSFPQYAGHDELLDALLGSVKGAEILMGDVVICWEQAERQAGEYGTGITREVLYLFVHSIMHLFGYDHMEEDDRTVMRSKEEEVLSATGVRREK